MLNLCLAATLHLLPGDWNAIHPCVYYEQNDWKTGVYYNSESRLSTFLVRDFGNIEVGLVTGYKGASVAPQIRFTKDQFFVMPAVTTEGDFGVVLGVELVWGIK